MKQDGIKYGGGAGNPAANEWGTWATDDVRPIGDAHGQIPQSAADALVASGLFSFVSLRVEATAEKKKSRKRKPK